MNGDHALQGDRKKGIMFRIGGVILLLLLLVGVAYGIHHTIQCIDGCGPYHNSASVADLDGDGDQDVVLSNLRHDGENGFWAGPTLWINQGDEIFKPLKVDFYGPSTAVGDIDGDGQADIITLDYGGANVYINPGNGTPAGFEKWDVSLAVARTGNNRGSLVLGDLNNDGQLDILVSYCCTTVGEVVPGGVGSSQFYPWVWINENATMGHSQGETHTLASLGDLPMVPYLGDMDGDGDLDIYAVSLPPIGTNYDIADRVLLNDGTGNFTDSGQKLDNPRETGSAGSSAAALGDLDGDGDLDAMAATTHAVAIWTNQGGAQGGQEGVFIDSGARLDGNAIQTILLEDFDNDGDLDALLGGKSQASIWWNEGQAGFVDSGQRLRYTERHGLAVGDFNDDGYGDIFSAAYDLEYHLWINQGDGNFQQVK